jgi:hypothetical protein
LSDQYDEGVVQGEVKAAQTRILWSQVQVLVGPPEKQTLIRNGGGFVFFRLPYDQGLNLSEEIDEYI